MELLPQEIKVWILFFCDDDSLALSLPRVSKLYNKLLEDNGAIWKTKCSLKNKNEKRKLPDQSWKQFYFNENLSLFPLYGFTIGKSTYDEMRVVPNAFAKTQDTSRYIIYQGQDFWFGTGTVFHMMYMADRDLLPTEWTDQGLNLKLSWVQCKELLKKKVGNYRVIEKPHYREFSGKQCFSATISAILRQTEYDVYYQIEFGYAYNQGDENTEETMYNITILSAESYEIEYFEDRYLNGKCEDDP